ncbi:MAG: A/G-specific adenine glycosylase [Armatimonadota bacterium]|nr:A/G-specific adenine glycosylase [Armatimonadota bacterium]
MARSKSSLTQVLLSWYSQNGRQLPWRKTKDPYAIWISEIMLQQTRAEVVIPYYERFLQAFPTVQALAQAPLDTVLRLWEGLGYYSRARNLHRAAKHIVRHGGTFPRDAKEWKELPGIGPYTAAALAAIVNGQDAIALDANLLRVGARLFGERGIVTSPVVRKRIERRFLELLPPGKAGTFNQALMDLGATVCLPRNPQCEACPLRRFCVAQATGQQEKIPVRARRRVRPHKQFIAAVLQDERGRLLLVRQADRGIWGGLWTLPYVEARSWREARPKLEAITGTRMKRTAGRSPYSITHTFTHFTATYTAIPAIPTTRVRHGRWVRPEQPNLAVPVPHRKLLQAFSRGGFGAIPHARTPSNP